MIDVVGFVSSFITGFLQMILDFVMFICNLILMPIDAIISSLIPDYVSLTSYINDYLVLASTYLGYLLDSCGFYSGTIILLVAALTFRLTLPLQIWVAKLAVRWYNALKT